jgi:DNA (cytosine-5)-methyltransferase 1
VTPSRPTAVELCAGMGGVGIALEALGYDVRRAYDSWQEAVDIYNHNFGGEVAQQCNLLSHVGPLRIKEAKREIGDVDLVVAGPPCKGFSQLRNGHHDGRSGPNRVLAAMPDYLALLRPRMFLIENVPDLIRHRGGRTLKDLLPRLERPAKGLRYYVQHGVYDSALFGTPQARKRVLILGVRGNARKHRLPEPGPDLTLLYGAVRHGGTVPKELRPYLDILRDPNERRLTTARQALSDLPILRPGHSGKNATYRAAPQTAFQRWVRRDAPKLLSDARTPNVTGETRERLGHIPPGGCVRFIPREELNGLARRYDSAYRRLHPGAPSTALSTKYDCVYHYTQPRSLSVREYARLQAIPDRITFPEDLACRRSAYEMIGNSVPPPLIEGVLSAVLEIETEGCP